MFMRTLLALSLAALALAVPVAQPQGDLGASLEDALDNVGDLVDQLLTGKTLPWYGLLCDTGFEVADLLEQRTRTNGVANEWDKCDDKT
ncbi:hypothetical protein EDB89DRAFT_2078000 [Lactarius sanguifluus]|nr:hypothetical protein EDB89DRAFT_2078000 [Lactarius sanguifluus]